MRTPTESSMITISPKQTSAPPISTSIFSPAERGRRITLPASSSRICRSVNGLRSNCTSTSRRRSAISSISCSGVMRLTSIRLLDQIDYVLAHLIGRRHHFRVGVVALLKDQQVGELSRDVYGGGFQLAPQNLTAPAVVRQPDRGL